MKAPIGIVVLCLLTACSHLAPKVDCEGHLTAINPPAPVVKPPLAPAASTTPAVPTLNAKAETP
jgi:hypothetical protein